MRRVRPIRAMELAGIVFLGAVGTASAQNGLFGGVQGANVQSLPSMRELSTDRPDKTESPFTVDAGHFQIEIDLANFTSDGLSEDGARHRVETLGIAPINLKYGTGLNSDLQFVVETYVRRTTTDLSTGAGDIVDGFGDLAIRFKQNLFGNDSGGQALAIMPFISLPTGSRGIGNAFVQGGVIFPLAIDLLHGTSLGIMTEVDLLADAVGRYSPSFVNSATLGFDLTERLGLYTEIYTERSLASGAAWIVTLDAGITYALAPYLQIDTGVNVGATGAADDFAVFVGLSRRF